MSMVNPVQIVVGGGWGSEAKGAIAAYLALKDEVDIGVRTGATNAGHTAYYDGTPVVMQQLPVSFVNPNTSLVLGAGALIDVDILNREVELINRLTGRDVRERLTIDYRAYIHRTAHHDRATAANRHHLMGATGKGCSEALIDRVRLRGLDDWTVGHNPELFQGYQIADTEQLLNYAWDEGAKIQLEGTQGQLLDLYLGPYPYTTHKQTGPAQWMSEAGLSPALPTDVVMVIRTYPIRVAGNSGPMPLEISWPILAREINDKRTMAGLAPIVSEYAIAEFENAVRRASVSFDIPTGSDGLDQHEWSDRMYHRAALSELNKAALLLLPDEVRAELLNLFEMTTVTKKLRRVARLGDESLLAAARQIRPHRVALTFMNYAFPERWFTSDPVTDETELTYIRFVSELCKSPVFAVSRGPANHHIVEVSNGDGA
jgi:adenylosuccinate synthase